MEMSPAVHSGTWRRQGFVSVLPEVQRADAHPDAIVDRLSLIALLDLLPPRRRAVLVLRYCCDLSIEQTARLLGCSAGTVKSQSARALATLRLRMTLPPYRSVWLP